ncbi:MAG: hypothetical protein ACKVZJ_02130 [Phycisphaerales bacterium]
MTRKQIVIMLTVLFIVDGIVVGALISATASPQIGVPVGLAAMVLPFALVSAVTGGLLRACGWGSLSRDFPAREPAEGAKPKVAPSFVAGKVPMNNAMEYAADDQCLHLTPVFSFTGMAPRVSIPWEHVSFPNDGAPVPTKLAGTLVEIEVSGRRMRLPPDAVSRELELRRAIAREEAATGTSA